MHACVDCVQVHNDWDDAGRDKPLIIEGGVGQKLWSFVQLGGGVRLSVNRYINVLRIAVGGGEEQIFWLNKGDVGKGC